MKFILAIKDYIWIQNLIKNHKVYKFIKKCFNNGKSIQHLCINQKTNWQIRIESLCYGVKRIKIYV